MIELQMGTNGIHGMSENFEDYGSVDNKGLVKRGNVVDWDDDVSVLLEMNSEDKTHQENKLLNEQLLYDVEYQSMEETIVHDIRGLENDAENNKVKAVEEEEVKNEDEEIRAEEHKAETAIKSMDELAGRNLTEHEEIRDVAEQAQSENNGVNVMEEKSETDIEMAKEPVKTEEKDFRDVKVESEDNEVRVVKNQNETEIIMGANERSEDGDEDITGAKKKAESDNNEIKVLEAQAETGNKVSFEQCDTENRTPDKKLGQEGEQANARSHLSSLSDLSKLDQWDVGSSSQRELDHCITAPIGTIGVLGNSLIDSHDIILSRSKTQKDSPFDRLSEREKRKLIVDLVKIQKDGTVEVDITRNAPVASELLELQAAERVPSSFDDCPPEVKRSIPRLKIAMLVVGTRGDVQPFLAMAKRLQEFGHYVRLATHTNFREFVKSAGVEFYPLGGDPRVLAGYMARNKGFIPSGPGEISIQRKQIKQIIESLLPACTEADTETGAPFRAQAVIANPPAYGHAHVAEALGVPIHIFFTMPWTPTYEFPHPLARVPQSAGNWLSYTVVDLLIWWGIRSYINDFRKRKLKLAPIAYFSMYSGSISHLPTGYMWSPYVVPKPNDWGSLVDVVGYCFLNLGAKYEPREDFVKWLAKGSKPIYIGFGSMPLEDPKKTTSIILEALKDTGQRGILDRGWGDLGIFSEAPDYIFLLENCPHDWLFPQCSAVVHHGGAGTTATGLKAGCPTTVVPFFGDQFFWGDRIHQKGLGPEPVPIAQLTVESLSNAITYMLQPEVKSRAIEIAKLIENEDGVAAAVDSFHKHLPPELPLPPANLDENDHPSAVQWLFGQIGRLCCLPCS